MLKKERKNLAPDKLKALREYERIYAQKVREENREKYNKKSREWRKNNIERSKAQKLKHWHLHKNNYLQKQRQRYDTYLYDHVREDVFKKWGNRCFLCKVTQEELKKKRKHGLHLHHIDGSGAYGSLVKAGFTTEAGIKIRATINNNIENLIPLCGSCHKKNHNFARLTKFILPQG